VRDHSTAPIVDLAAHNKPVFGIRMGDVLTCPYRLLTCSTDHLVKIFDFRMANKSLEEIPHWIAVRGKRATGETTLSAHAEAVLAICMTDSKIFSGSADGSIKVFKF
jgi:WD40 repeat protein